MPYVRDRRDLLVDLREHLSWCPRCGALLVLILPKRNQFFEPFMGCSEYDIGCRGTRDIGLDGEPVEAVTKHIDILDVMIKVSKEEDND